jgi:glyoxylase-like metal-dependent hydrolase (beta-lactamase superfamily II)
MIDQLLIGNYRNFVYLVTFDGESIVIDPQSDLKPWEDRIRELGSRLVGVALTHTHWDHVAGVPGILEKYGRLPVYVHELDAHRIKKPYVVVRDGDPIPVGGESLKTIHAPGHSAGECCFLLEEGKSHHLFTGDTVFVGDVGRTDLESGSTREMFETIQRLKKLPGDAVIYPGHDYGRTKTSTVARESAESAAFRCKTVEELDALP